VSRLPVHRSLLGVRRWHQSVHAVRPEQEHFSTGRCRSLPGVTARFLDVPGSSSRQCTYQRHIRDATKIQSCERAVQEHRQACSAKMMEAAAGRGFTRSPAACHAARFRSSSRCSTCGGLANSVFIGGPTSSRRGNVTPSQAHKLTLYTFSHNERHRPPGELFGAPLAASVARQRAQRCTLLASTDHELEVVHLVLVVISAAATYLTPGSWCAAGQIDRTGVRRPPSIRLDAPTSSAERCCSPGLNLPAGVLCFSTVSRATSGLSVSSLHQQFSTAHGRRPPTSAYRQLGKKLAPKRT